MLAQRGGFKGYAHCRRPLFETLEDLLNVFGYLLETFGDLLETLGDLLETFGDLLETLGDLLGDSWRPTGYPWRACWLLHCPTGGVWVVPDGLQIGKK